MPSTLSRRLPTFRAARAALVLSTLALAAACDDDPTGDDHDEPEIEAVRLIVTTGGTATTYTVTANGATPSPVQLRVGTSTVAAVALDQSGAAIDLHDEFELRMSGLPAGVTFTRTGALAGSITAPAATTTNAQVSAIMWHLEENHDDYTANFPLRVVQ